MQGLPSCMLLRLRLCSICTSQIVLPAYHLRLWSSRVLSASSEMRLQITLLVARVYTLEGGRGRVIGSTRTGWHPWSQRCK